MKNEILFLYAVSKMASWLKYNSVPSSANESSAALSLASVLQFTICIPQDLQESIQDWDIPTLIMADRNDHGKEKF